MPLSAEWYQQLYRQQNTYHPNASVQQAMREKVLIMVVGPAAVGKSTLMNEVVAQNNNYARVSGFTTREARANDEANLYRYLVSEDQVADCVEKIEKGAVVQYAIHPTTYKMYGSEIQDYPKHFNLLDTLSSVVKGLEKLPFERTVTIGLLAPPDTWEKWFKARYPNPSSEAYKRLIEARQSLEWLVLNKLDQNLVWLVNKEGALFETARQLIDTTVNPTRIPTYDGGIAPLLLEKVKALLEEYQK